MPLLPNPGKVPRFPISKIRMPCYAKPRLSVGGGADSALEILISNLQKHVMEFSWNRNKLRFSLLSKIHIGKFFGSE